MENFEIGQIIEVTVSEIKPYAAFLDIGENNRGLLHISEISDKFVKDIENFVSKGDKLNVIILSIDEKDGFIRTSLKKVPKEQQKNTHQNARIKPIVSEDDFAPLKEKLPQWIEKSLKEKEGK